MLLAPQYVGDLLDLCMEMPVLPLDPSGSSCCCRTPTAQRETEPGLQAPSLPPVLYLGSQAETPRPRTGSWIDVIVICHMKGYPITFTMAAQQKHRNTEGFQLQLPPTLPPPMFRRTIFFWKCSLLLSAQRNLGRA